MPELIDDVVLVGDWVKERTLGSGSFGIVILWKHRHSNERLAIKTCRWESELTQKQRERWTKEVDMLKTCENENIVATRELPSEFVCGLERANPSKLPILCMEYCSGGDLRQLLNRAECVSGLKEIQVRKILSDVKNAVEFLHKNKITHRDLKPENIVMKMPAPEEDASQSRVTYKLIDLGYAKEIDCNSVCASFVGTLQYLAPELFYSKTYSNSVDFWSFGLLAFEVVCGVRPFLPHMAPVQWMPKVKEKSKDHICVFETYHGDVQYSNEMFPENQVTAPFKSLLEGWLKIALDYDPKLRGREGTTKGVKFDIPTDNVQDVDRKFGKVTLFSVLQDVLSRKIIKIFSAYSLEMLAYEIDDSVTVSTLRKWIERDVKIPVDQQALLSLTYVTISNEDLAEKYWNNQCGVMLFLYSKEDFMKHDIQPQVPKAVQRCLEQPKTLYNFKNSRDLYKSSVHFILSEKELYDSLITSCLTKAESLKVDGKELFLKHNDVDKSIEKLRTMQSILSKTLDTSRSHLDEINHKSPAAFSELFQKIFTSAETALEKFSVLEVAWHTVTTRLQSATRRSNELSPSELLNSFVSKFNFQTLLSDMMKAYVHFKLKEREFRATEKPCPEVVKICYNILKMRDKILQELRNQPFVLRLLDINLEFSKITSTIDTAAENANKLLSEMSNIIDELVQSSWQTIKALSPLTNEHEDVPYSVVSFEKRHFKVGHPVTDHWGNIPAVNGYEPGDEELQSLLDESLELKELQNELADKLDMHKREIQDGYDFTFLDE